MKNKLSSSEFQNMIKSGQLDVQKGRLVTVGDILDKYEQPLKPKKKRKPTPEMDRDIILNNIREYKKQGKIYIPYDVRSSKNSQIIKYHSMQKSLAVREYVLLSWKWWNLQTGLFRELTKGKEYPLTIGFFWLRGTKQLWDYFNMGQLPCDIMNGQMSFDSVMGKKKEERIGLNWIPDDDVDHIKPIIEGYKLDRENRGLVLSIY